MTELLYKEAEKRMELFNLIKIPEINKLPKEYEVIATLKLSKNSIRRLVINNKNLNLLKGNSDESN